MMRTLDKEVFKAFKVPLKRFIRFLLELHDVLPNESGLVKWIDFFKKTLMKSSHDVMEPAAKVYNYFLVKFLRENGMNLNLIASSTRWRIFIIKHTSLNSFMKKYASSDSKS